MRVQITFWVSVFLLSFFIWINTQSGTGRSWSNSIFNFGRKLHTAVWWPCVCLIWKNAYLGLLPVLFMVSFAVQKLVSLTSFHFLIFGFFFYSLGRLESSLVAQMVKRLLAMRETQVRSLGWEDLLEKETATHSSTLAWRIPRMEEPGRLQSMGSQRVGHDWATSLSLLGDWPKNLQLLPCQLLQLT